MCDKQGRLYGVAPTRFIQNMLILSNMLHRTFIAINLKEGIKNKVLSYKEDFSEIPAKWVKKENIHITLSFLGNLDDTQLMETIEMADNIISEYDPFILNINEIGLGPKFPPRLIWLTLDENQELNKLHSELDDAIYSLDSYRFKVREERSFVPHITLARIKSFESKKLSKEVFEIKKSLKLSFEVTSIDIIESGLKKDGPEYVILKSIEL